MKRILAWVLLLVMVLGMFAGCKRAEEPTPTTEPSTTTPTNPVVMGPGAQDAIDALASDYPNSGEKTPVDYTRYAKKRVGGIVFDVVWTVAFAEDVENPDELVKITISEDGETAYIDVFEESEKDIPYTLTATITDESGASASFTWNYILPKMEDMVSIVEEAYALESGEIMDREVMLRGKIVSLDSVYSEEHNNITVTIAVEGAEDKPIKCYRLTSTADTYDYIKNLLVGNIITVSGIIKNYNGTIEFDTGCKLLAYELGEAITVPTEVGDILKAAYALGKNETLPYPVTLTGVVTEIDKPYDPDYSNISVVIEVEGYEKYPILCYRMKGMEAENIAINDTITVSGIIKNYNGTIEFDTGCQLKSRISGGGVAQKPSSDAAKILADAAKLSAGEKLPYIATLTGEIYSVDKAFDSEYGNVTVTIKVNGVKIQCYRLSGDGANMIRETDKITVTGVIENYQGKLEFGSGCKLDSWEKGPRNVNYGPVKEDVAYRLYIDQKGIDKTVYFNGKFSSNRLQSTTTGSKGADVYAERISGKGLRFFYMDGQTKTYIEIEEFTNDKGQQRGGVRITTTPSCYWVYNSEFGIYVVNLPTAGKYMLGTYSTYDTFSASWLGYIDGSVASTSTQYVAKFVEASKVQDEEPSATVVQGTAVENPVPGTGYKFGFYQNQAEGKPFLAFNGKIAAKYYFGTANAIADMVDVYLEEADGGYYIYFMDGKTKTYLDIAPRDNDPTKVNTVFQTSGTHTVWSLNKEHKYVYATEAGSEWYLGTYGTNTTISASKTSYISDKSTIGVSQFCAWFSTVEEVEAPETPTEPSEPKPSEPENAIVEAGVAYKLYMVQSGIGKTLYFNGTVSSNRLQTTTVAKQAIDVYAELDGSKIRFYYMDGSTKNYIEIEEYTNSKGQLRGQVTVTTAPTCYWSYDQANGVYVVTLPNAGNYFLGTYGTYDTISASWVGYIDGTYSGSEQYIAKFIKASDVSDEPTNPTEPQPSEPAGNAGVVAVPEVETAYKLGMDKNEGAILYFTGNTADKSYRLETTTDASKAVDVKLEAADGGYRLYFMKDGAKTYIRVSEYTKDDGNLSGTLELTTSVPEEIFTYDESVKTLIYTNGENSYYIGTFGTYTNFSVSSTYFISGDKASTIDVSQFPARFYIVEEGSEPQPTDPKPTEPVDPSNGFNKITSAEDFTSGQYVMIVNTGYAPGVYDNKWLSAVQPVVSGNTVTDTKGAVWTLTVNGNSVTITDANGVTIKPMGADKNGVLDGSYDWAWSFKNGTFTFAGVGADVVVLASNTTTTGQYPGNHRFRGYKVSTVNGRPSEYPSQFTLYKLGGEPGETPDVTEPEETKPATGIEMVTNPAANTAYKWYLEQNNVGKTLYFAGTTTDREYYLQTTENVAEATDVYLEATNGGFYLYFFDASGAKTYVDMYQNGTYKNLRLTSEPGVVYTYNAEYNTLVAPVDGEDCYIGTYDIHKTLGCSKFSYITTSFPSHFAVIGEGVEPDVTEPEVTEPQPTAPSGNTLTIEQAIAMGSAMAHDTYTTDKYYVTGVITEVYNEQYGNMRLKDNAGNILTIYGTYGADGKDRYDALSVKPVAGDTVTIYGKVGQYNNVAQIKNGWIVAHTPAGSAPEATEPQPTPPSGNTLTIAQAVAMGSAMAHDTYTTEKYYVTGVITEVYNEQYGNMRLKDNAGNILTIYGTYGADGKDRYDALSVKPVAGDTVTIYGKVGQYNNVAQIKNGWIAAHTPAGSEPEVTEPEVTEPVAGESVTYTFKNYAKGVGYGENEEHVLDSLMTVYTNQCFFTSQLRLYQDKQGDGVAVFAAAKPISKVLLNAGHYASGLKVYASVDGETWVEIETLAIQETSQSSSADYNNYTVSLPNNASYRYLKLDAVDKQVRIAYMTFWFAN